MGMFDYVNYSAPCPKCGATLESWQTKSSPCQLDTLEPWQVKDFYTSCSKCGAWVTAKVDAQVRVEVLSCEVKLAVNEDMRERVYIHKWSSALPKGGVS